MSVNEVRDRSRGGNSSNRQGTPFKGKNTRNFSGDHNHHRPRREFSSKTSGRDANNNFKTRDKSDFSGKKTQVVLHR